MEIIEEEAENRPEYRRILYEEQPYEDNHVSKDFLKWLVDNTEKVEDYDYKLCVMEICPVVEQIAFILIYWNVFEILQKRLVSIEFFIAFEYSIFFLGYIVYNILRRTSEEGDSLLWKLFRTFVLVLLLYYISPLLQTLTMSISSDTIEAMVFFLLTIHLFTHDYSYINGYTKTFRCTLSLNSVVFSSILLASRMDDVRMTFGYISFAILVFAVLPVIRNWINLSVSEDPNEMEHVEKKEKMTIRDEEVTRRGFLSYFFTVFVVLVSNVLLYKLHHLKHVILYWFSILFIMLGIPGVLIWIQSNIRKKCSFRGPWDSVTLLSLEKDFE